MGIFSQFYYNRKLKSLLARRKVERSFVNLEKLNHLVVAFECEDYIELREIEKSIAPVLKSLPRLTYVIYLNMDKLEEFEWTSSHDVILFKEDIKRKITPSNEFIEIVDGLKPDVWVNLCSKESPVIDFFTKISLAQMRVGFENKQDLLDLMITVPEGKDVKFFLEKMITLLGQIKAGNVT